LKILITGAAGGIGSLLTESLILAGHDVYPLDNFRNGYESNLNLSEIDERRFINLDIRDPYLYKKIPFGLDCVLHLAAITSLPECEANPLDTLSINTGGTLNLLEAARKTECKYFILASTSAVYENNREQIFSEDLSVDPILNYSLSKKLAEDLCLAYAEKYSMRIAIARLFNVFGPNQDTNRPNPPLLNYLVREFIHGTSPVIHSDGTQSRDYISVKDVMDFVLSCIDIQPTGIFNVCSGKLLSVNTVAEIVSKTLGVSQGVIYQEASKLWDTYPDLFTGKYPLRKELVKKETLKLSLGSGEKSKRILNWAPSSDVESQIGATVLEIRNRFI
jgi:nucleoside-diphosphate-sugar epimerase